MDRSLTDIQGMIVTAALQLPWSPARRTLGGLVFWTDVAVAHGWRVQCHSRTGRTRLLDPRDRLMMAGSPDACHARFVQETATLPARQSVVMLVHPMGGSRLWMRPTERYLRAAGFTIESFTYASMRADVPVHAARLNEVIEAWDDVQSIAFVTVSMGGPVVAAALAAQPDWRKRVTIRSVVMMCPPAQGAALARIGQRIPPARGLLGPALATLGFRPMPTSGLADLPVLIIAGKIPFGNPLLRGADDGIVRVAETRIDIPHRHMIVPAFHAGVQRHPACKRAVVQWLTEAHKNT
jgi:pimeloyl-ACP methyl ester carboxylesterase